MKINSFYDFGNIHYKDAQGFWRNEVCANLEPILQKYPDYKPNEYILWIDEFILIPVPWKTLSVRLHLLDEHGEVLQNLTKDIRVGKLSRQTAQMKLRNGRCSVYGVPIRFKTFEELNRVKTVHVAWEIGFELKEEYIVSLQHMTYDVKFIPDAHKRFYTISENAICNISLGWKNEQMRTWFDNWINDFSVIEEIAGRANDEDTRMLKRVVDEYHLNIMWQSNKTWLVTICQQNIKLNPKDFGATAQRSKRFADEDLACFQKFIDYHESYNPIKVNITIHTEDFELSLTKDYTEYAADLIKCNNVFASTGEKITEENVREYFKSGTFHMDQDSIDALNGNHFLFGFVESIFQNDKYANLLRDFDDITFVVKLL